MSTTNATVNLKKAVAIAFVAMLVCLGAWQGSQYYFFNRTLAEIESAVEERDNQAALEKLQQFLLSNPDHAHAHLLAARTSRRLKAYFDAKEHLRICKEKGGNAEAIEVESALIDVQRGDETNIEWLRQRSSKEDKLALVILEVLIQYDLDTYQLWSALDDFKRLLAQRPNDLQALLGRGRVWERFLYFKDALADYQTAVNSHPNNEIARLKLAETLLTVGTPAEALAEFQTLAERFPNKAEVRFGLARCYRQLGKADESRKLLDELIREFPDHGEANWECGQLAAEDGKIVEAEALLRKASQLMPFDRRVNFSLYRCLLDLKKNEEAEKVNDRVKKIDADIRRLDEVRQEVMKKPNDVALRIEGGLLFLNNGEKREGLRWLQHALKIDPKNQAALNAIRDTERIEPKPKN